MEINWRIRIVILLIITLISYGAVSVLAKDKANEVFSDPNVAALVVAASRGNVKEIDRLIDSGVNVNARGQGGMTPLAYVLDQENIEGVARLLHHGADPNLVYNEQQDSTMRRFVVRKDPTYLELALDYGGDVNALMYGKDGKPVIFDAITLGRIANVKLLINAGADVNRQDSFSGETPLHATGYSRKYEIAYILLEAGADPRINDKAGKNGLLRAIEKTQRPGSEEIYQWRQKVIEYLRAAGMEIDPKYP